MKKNSLLFFGILFLMAALNSCSPAVVRVNARPAVTVGVRPLAPSPRHVWIAEEYRWRGGKYVVVPGYWSNPRVGYTTYVPGHWKNTRRGVKWVPGHWR